MKNIIFYFSDQQRWDTCGCYGQPLDITPNLDRLSSEGVKFENAFSPQPVCGPCRALFQTGRYPTETGCFRNNVMLPQGIKRLEITSKRQGMRRHTSENGIWQATASWRSLRSSITRSQPFRGSFAEDIRATGGLRTYLSLRLTATTDASLTKTTTELISKDTARTASMIWRWNF